MKKYIISAFLFLAAIFAAMHTASAATRPAGPLHGAADSSAFLRSHDSDRITSQFEEILANRIRRYSAFEANMPSMIPSDVQTILNAELRGSIARMQATLTAFDDATGTPASDLNPKPKSKESESDTQDDDLLLVKMSMLELAFRPAPTVAATSTLKPDLIDRIIHVDSMRDVQSVMRQVVEEVETVTGSQSADQSQLLPVSASTTEQ